MDCHSRESDDHERTIDSNPRTCSLREIKIIRLSNRRNSEESDLSISM